jgi:uncharacterized membrane protein (UPF0182 family)
VPAALPEATAASEADPASLTAQAQQAYERAIAAQRNGDWAAYGREIERLGALLGQLQSQP